MHFIFGKITIFIFFFLYPITSQTNNVDEKKFFSTKFNEVNIRNGPGINYFIIGKHLKKGLPLLVVGEFDNWKRIVNFLGVEGWVANSQISKKRYGITIVKESEIKSFPKKNSKVLMILGEKINFPIQKCSNDWCKIKYNNKTGWIEKKNFWGVFKKEIFN